MPNSFRNIFLGKKFSYKYLSVLPINLLSPENLLSIKASFPSFFVSPLYDVEDKAFLFRSYVLNIIIFFLPVTPYV